jgi:hypothetical protein
VIFIAATVIISAVADQLAVNLAILALLALLLPFAMTEPPVMLLLAAVTALLAPALAAALAEHVKAKVAQAVLFAIDVEEAGKVEFFVTNRVVTAGLVLTEMVVIPTLFPLAVVTGDDARRVGNRCHRCSDDCRRCGDATHVLQKLTPLHWFHTSPRLSNAGPISIMFRNRL